MINRDKCTMILFWNQGLLAKFLWYKIVFKIRFGPRVTKAHLVNPWHFFVELNVGYIFSDIHWIIMIKHNNLFWNIVPNV